MKQLMMVGLLCSMVVVSGCWSNTSTTPVSQSTGTATVTGDTALIDQTGSVIDFGDSGDVADDQMIESGDDIHNQSGADLSLEQLLSGEDLSEDDRRALQEITILLQGEGEKTPK